MPTCDLVFILAGGDVLAGDPMGRLGLTLAGAWERDRRVAARIGDTPAVWLPAGGYQPEAWKVLVGTLYVLIRGRPPRLAGTIDPLRDRFRRVAASLPAERLGGDREAPSDEIDFSDVEIELGLRRASDGRLLGFYTREGIELALFRLGLLAHLERLGYRDFPRRDHGRRARSGGSRLRLWGRFEDEPKDAPGHILVEALLEKQLRAVPGPVLYVHWLALRHPRSAFAQGRPALPGRTSPASGSRTKRRRCSATWRSVWGCAASWCARRGFHVAYVGRTRFRFLDAEAQGNLRCAGARICAPIPNSARRPMHSPWPGRAERWPPVTCSASAWIRRPVRSCRACPTSGPRTRSSIPSSTAPPAPEWSEARAQVARRTRFVRAAPA
jgi:hypothetical protein